MKIAFKTFGCRLNISETESIISQIENKEDITKDLKIADIIVINTCTVTAEAEKKCIRLLNQLLAEDKICISTGCFDPTKIIKNDKLIYYSLDNKGDVEVLIKNIIDYLNQNKLPIKEFSFKKFSENEKSYRSYQNRFLRPTLDKRFHSRAFLKIQDGCNNNCAYCKVHIVRGKEQSLDYEKVLDSIEKIYSSGFKEIVLTGINIAKYNFNNINFTKLLLNLIKLFPNIIFQLSSIEVDNLNEEFFEIIKLPNIKPYFHLPIQSGSDFILTRMRRKYTIKEYTNAINKIKSSRPDAFLSTDIIVGFPGENKETIKQTENIVREIGFHHLHLFPFSKREETDAYNMEETFSNEEKSFYIERLNNITKGFKNRFINSFIGKQDYIMVEKIERKQNNNDKNNLIIYGKSYHNLLIKAFYKNNFEVYKGDYLTTYILGKDKNILIGMV
ncbi:MAG TPA: MiaB/RimO family radical SAM methylthiotransferase [Exilispira sp.]|nr:MiaB/RimO family radical SAM methylthiotransferase [Exilispira sp.]